MGSLARTVSSVLLFSATGFCQLPSSFCDSLQSKVADCLFLTQSDSDSHATALAAKVSTDFNGGVSSLIDPGTTVPDAPNSDPVSAFVSTPRSFRRESFHWGRALLESFTFLAIEQAYVVHDDYRWVVVENRVPFNHYWSDYKHSLSTWVNSGWDDGDPLLYSYVGHPIQGALTGYIQIQNDPQGEKLELANTKAYWWSRFKALMWNAAYSMQWNIGPLSELTVEKYGTKVRSFWNPDNTWPCTSRHCVTGVGQVDLVMTPAGGFAWMLTEDFLDKEIARRVEGATRNHFLIDFTRCALNPIRGGANILHGKRPWHRASRDASELYFIRQSQKLVPPIRDVSSAGESH
jgi:hypothetical protein